MIAHNSSINLLPPDIKQSYRYARRNRRLVFWVLAFGLAIAGVAALTVIGVLLMNRSMDTQRNDLASIQSRLDSPELAGVKQEATVLSNNLKLMVNVLSSEVLFSKLLVQLGNITPPNVVLTNLSITQTVGAIDITARAKNYDAATQMQANLADPGNQIFSKADIVSITCSGEGTEGIAADYPCTVTVKVLFAEDNPFMFINTKQGGQ